MDQHQTLKIKNTKIKAPQKIIKNLQDDLDKIFMLIHLIKYNLDLHFFPSFKNKISDHQYRWQIHTNVQLNQ